MTTEAETGWHKAQDGGGVTFIEKKVGDFWLAVAQDGTDAGVWDATLDVRSRYTSHGRTEDDRVTIFVSIDVGTLEQAQGAADKMVEDLVAPFVADAKRERDEARAELARVRAELAVAVEASARGVAEYVALLSASAGAERSFHREMMAKNEIRDGMQALARAHALERAVSDIRAISATRPAPVVVESLDVDPEASAYR